MIWGVLWESAGKERAREMGTSTQMAGRDRRMTALTPVMPCPSAALLCKRGSPTPTYRGWSFGALQTALSLGTARPGAEEESCLCDCLVCTL